MAKMGRPTKLTKKWLEIAEEVINTDINAIILTDEELVFLINEKVDEKERISNRTFERWKSKNKISEGEDKEEKEEELDEMGKDFCRLIKKALLKQKQSLFKSLKDDEKQWQRFAWIIERKFDAWNIKHKSDITSNGDGLNSLVVKIQEQNQPLVNENNRNTQRTDNESGVVEKAKRQELEIKKSILD